MDRRTEWGHLCAIEGAPILDYKGMNVIAHWAKELRCSQFETVMRWEVPTISPDRPIYSADAGPVAVKATSHIYSVSLQFSRGEAQVWQMDRYVDPDDAERIFARMPIVPADAPNPDDPRKLYKASMALLSSRAAHLSPMARSELEYVAAVQKERLQNRRAGA